MKKLITITLSVLIGIAFATQKLSTAQEMPIENHQKTYATNFSLELFPQQKESYNQFTVCPRDFSTYKQVLLCLMQLRFQNDAGRINRTQLP